MNKYTQQAENFASKYGVTLEILGCEYKPMWNETQKRSVFKLRLKRGRRSYTFEFGQSMQAGNTKPDMYSVLACLTKYSPESYGDFCGVYGYSLYDENTGRTNKQTERTYKAVCKEFAAVERLFSDCMEELQEIN